MKKNYLLFLLIIFLVFPLVFSACQVQSDLPSDKGTEATDISPDATSQPQLISTPSSKMTRICGHIITKDGDPAQNLPIMFAEVYYGDSNSDGAFVLNTASSPSALTDLEGNFCTADIAVSDYVLIIGNPDDFYEIYPDEAEKAKIWSTTAGQILDLGEVTTNLDL